MRIVQNELIPGKIIVLEDGKNSENILYRKNDVIGKMKQQNNRATAYVCHHHVCSLPVTDPEQLMAVLKTRRLEAL